MKKYFILLISILFLNFGNVFAVDNSYNKYLEYKKQEYSKMNVAMLLKILISDDCELFCNDKNNESETVGKLIMLNVEQYKSEPNEINYKYAVKAFDLYKSLCSQYKKYEQYLGQNQQSTNLQDKIIMIPDNDFNKLNKEIIFNIVLLNLSLK